MPTESEKAAGLLRGRVLLLDGGAVRPVYTPGPLWQRARHRGRYGGVLYGKGYRLNFSQGRLPHEILWE